MAELFGLSEEYLTHIRRTDKSKNVVARNILENMRESLRLNIEKWVKLYPLLTEKLLTVQSDLYSILNDYLTLLDPIPTPNYQMYRCHPNFNRDYFSDITSKEQAYWLGFLFADGYITVEHKEFRDYYRMGLSLARKDRDVLVKFCESIGLDIIYIEDFISTSHFSNNLYPMSRIRWGDQKFAQDLINLGMEYEFDNEKGRHVKVPVLPQFNRPLMLAFLLGFFDGDGTLNLGEYGRISPDICSTKEKFLLDIKKYFNLDQEMYSRVIERINPRRGIIVKTPYNRLNLGSKLFKEMMNNYHNSLNRKRVDENYYKDYFFGGEKAKIHNDQKIWLKRVIKKEELGKMLELLSPFRVSKMLGVSELSIIRLAEDYRIKHDFSKGYYITISNSIYNYGKQSKYYEAQHYWLNYLMTIGKFYS